MQKPGHLFLSIALIIFAAGSVSAQLTEFGYLGSLGVSGSPANASFDFEFALYDALAGGAQLGSTLTRSSVAAVNGVFSVKLDFGSQFPGANRFLEIRVRPAGGGAFTGLLPRQQISASPYSIRTISATTADSLSASCVDCVQNSQISSVAGTKITGTIPVASIPGASGSYIQNTTSPQAAANFNIAGNGTAASMNVNGALTQGGTAAPSVAPAGQGRIYFDSATNKVKVSENGAAFVNLVGATGVSGSGTVSTIPFWSAGTTLGNSQITQSVNGVQLPNGVQLATGAQGYQLSFGSPNGETGITIAGAAGRADLRFDGSTLKLFAGAVAGPPGNGISVSNNGGATVSGTNGDGAVITARRTGGDTFVVIDSAPTFRNSVLAYRKNNLNRWLMFADSTTESGSNAGSDFRLDAYGDAGGGVGTRLLVKRDTGNIGMGTNSPATRLSLNGGPAWTANGWTASMNFQNASAFGWEANASGQRFGIGQSTGGLYFFRTYAAFGQTIPPANYSMQISDNGHILQDRGASGLVKAMIVVNPNGTIARCYNGITGSVAAPCGFGISKAGFPDGDYTINFGFQVSDRFYSFTSLASDVVFGNIVSFPNANTFEVVTRYSTDGDYVDSPFSIIVY